MNIIKATVAVLGLLSLAACASNVNRDTSLSSGQRATVAPIGVVSVSLSEEARTAGTEQTRIDAAALKANVEKKLVEKSLLHAGAGNRLEIVVTKARLRSTGAAVMMGFMAGADSITGTVTVKDAKGQPGRRFEVSASYAMGGLIAGQEAMRVNWLYAEFAKQAADELSKN